MARAIWSGAISFGMVNIPIKLVGATESKDISFHLLHSTCGTRLKQVRWCPTDEVEVPWSETVRGYEYAKGQYVILTDEDFEKLPLPSRHTIDLSALRGVSRRSIRSTTSGATTSSPTSGGKSPTRCSSKRSRRRVWPALATITMRKKEQLCAIRPRDGSDPARDALLPRRDSKAPAVDLDGVRVNDRELDMAFTLIELLRKPFDPEEYHDHYREALEQLIEAKMEGREVVASPEERDTKVIDLADALCVA